MVMFTCQNQVSLSLDFPLKERTESVLTEHGVRNGNARPSEIKVALRGEEEIEEVHRQEGPVAFNQPGFPMPKLEIPLLDGNSSR